MSVLDVVEAIEGPVRLNLCLTSKEACARQGMCPAHPVWDEAQRAMVEVLRKSTIRDLAHPAAAKPDGHGDGSGGSHLRA